MIESHAVCFDNWTTIPEHWGINRGTGNGRDDRFDHRALLVEKSRALFVMISFLEVVEDREHLSWDCPRKMVHRGWKRLPGYAFSEKGKASHQKRKAVWEWDETEKTTDKGMGRNRVMTKDA
jgi:hypothetical protein